MVKCVACSTSSEDSPTFRRVVSIAGSIMGDECIESLYYCERCAKYTIEVYWDFFSGGESVSIEGPIPRERGDELVALIARCPTPTDKRCRCPAHIEYFDGGLD
jgi:hypothetical protein